MVHSIGIDISKDASDAHELPDGRTGRFDNGPAGFDSLKGWLPTADRTDRLVYEATGPYHADLERQFAGVYPLVKVNPLQARRFAQAQGNRAKTDAVDARILARMLAHMGKALDLAPQQPLSESLRDLKELQVARTALVKDQTRLRNRLQTQTVSFVMDQTKARLALVSQQLRDVDAEILIRIAAEQRQRRAHEIIRSIPGIGAVSAAAILIEMPEIGCSATIKMRGARQSG